MFFMEAVQKTRAKMKEINTKNSFTYYDLKVLEDLLAITLKAISDDLYISRELIEKMRSGLEKEVKIFIEAKKPLICDGIEDLESKQFVRKVEPIKDLPEEKDIEILVPEKPKTKKKTTKKKVVKKEKE